MQSDTRTHAHTQPLIATLASWAGLFKIYCCFLPFSVQLIDINLPSATLNLMCDVALCGSCLHVLLYLFLSCFSSIFFRLFIEFSATSTLINSFFFFSCHLQPAAQSQRMFRLTPRTIRPSWWCGSVRAWFMTRPSTGTPSPTRGCRAVTRASRSTGQMETRTWYERVSSHLSPKQMKTSLYKHVYTHLWPISCSTHMCVWPLNT